MRQTTLLMSQVSAGIPVEMSIPGEEAHEHCIQDPQREYRVSAKGG